MADKLDGQTTQATQQTTELAEVLGLKQHEVKVNGGRDTITLRPLSLRQQVEAGQKAFESDAETMQWVLFQSATRGGYQGTLEEFGDLLEGDEVLEAAEALASLSPKSAAIGTQTLAPVAAETGTAPSGA